MLNWKTTAADWLLIGRQPIKLCVFYYRHRTDSGQWSLAGWQKSNWLHESSASIGLATLLEKGKWSRCVHGRHFGLPTGRFLMSAGVRPGERLPAAIKTNINNKKNLSSVGFDRLWDWNVQRIAPRRKYRVRREWIRPIALREFIIIFTRKISHFFQSGSSGQ